ncbi:nicotinate-nucleotide adenylyltransferase [Shewanella schlegeliana]|uniref:Probable nicotinate-nucleotide adenylyltransferase n=1 Tax=Shewanella schlegeliana TaxID=190308 RepID=A0ABS1T0I4_9GAMM|nr:nicotinate-nucleotide adenylyltransferase [Shewanella schlegeliana]MBL4913684.1 nicotinate-nucleotide adenylyltransferase [Shewanella schlegeliana]MCL1108575.1 nicotinate-nucleotide adenylyltransferase [Shewanella schlegeliana]GIU31113.1 putative nicotinate-nucleotide adenylyltransferase [Shewanella schlegeliana]
MKIGILGGTFDPIHFGHIRPAQEVRQQLNLDEVWLMPNHIPPHKSSTHVSSQDRLAMAQLVCDQLPHFKLCDIEAKRDTPSYSAMTLTQLTKIYPEHEFYFIMGMDSFLSFTRWHKWQQLLDLCHLVVCKRPGWQLDTNDPIQSVLRPRVHDIATTTSEKFGRIFMVDITEQDISSTQVRQQLSLGNLPKGQLPTEIEAYIVNHHLYQNPTADNSN